MPVTVSGQSVTCHQRHIGTGGDNTLLKGCHLSPAGATLGRAADLEARRTVAEIPPAIAAMLADLEGPSHLRCRQLQASGSLPKSREFRPFFGRCANPSAINGAPSRSWLGYRRPHEA